MLSADAEPGPGTGLGRWHYIALTAIILLEGLLRFGWLDRPALWGDEAATRARTCGTFREMLVENRGDGFVPLHYELYWALGKVWKLTPWRMRLVPAMAGTLMVPGMYFLARQLVRSRTALLVTLLTAVSAFLLNYSRDAKMYMEVWLFATLHVAFLVWWLRGGGGVAWWAWVACGVATVGLHSVGWLVVPVELLLFLTYRRWRFGWRGLFRWMVFAVGLMIMAAGPIIFYGYYNNWTQRSGGLAPGVGGPTPGTWSLSGISWVEVQTRDKTGLQLVRESASAYLYGYSRAEEDTTSGEPEIPAWVLNTAWGSLAGIVVVLLMGALYWPKVPEAALKTDPEWAPWRPTLWLAFWLVVPTYGFFYCRSVPYSLAPHHWLIGIGRFVGWNILWALPICFGLILIARSRRWVVLMLAWIVVALLAMVLALSVWRGKAQWYVDLMDLGSRPWIIIGLIAVALAMSWSAMNSAGRRAIGLGAVILTVLGVCEGTWWIWEMLRQSAGRPGVDWQSMWMPRYLGVVWPAMAIVMAVAVGRLPSRVFRVTVVVALCALNLAQHVAHVYLDNEPRIDRIAHDIVQGERQKALKVYVRDGFQTAAPGMASVYDVVGHYYLALELGGAYTPAEMRRGFSQSMITINRFQSAGALAEEMRRDMTINRIVLWDRLSSVGERQADEIQAALGANWVLTNQWVQETWRHWNWQHLDTLRRLEFVRAGAMSGATQATLATGSSRP